MGRAWTTAAYSRSGGGATDAAADPQSTRLTLAGDGAAPAAATAALCPSTA